MENEVPDAWKAIAEILKKAPLPSSAEFERASWGSIKQNQIDAERIVSRVRSNHNLYGRPVRRQPPRMPTVIIEVYGAKMTYSIDAVDNVVREELLGYSRLYKQDFNHLYESACLLCRVSRRKDPKRSGPARLQRYRDIVGDLVQKERKRGTLAAPLG